MRRVLILLILTLLPLPRAACCGAPEPSIQCSVTYETELCGASEKPEDSASASPVPLPVIMYHSVLRHPNVPGSDYIVPPETVRDDAAWLRAHGYTPIRLSELAAFADGDGSLPEKPVLLTFDDGYLNNAVYLPQIAKTLDAPMLLCVVGRFADDAETCFDRSPAYATLRWGDLRRLRDTGLFEFACHTYDMHKLTPRRGIAPLPGEDPAAYRQALRADLSLMQTRLLDELGQRSACFAYPFGAEADPAAEVLDDLGFRVRLTCRDMPNYVTPGHCLTLGRLNRPPGESTEAFMQRLLRHYA